MKTLLIKTIVFSTFFSYSLPSAFAKLRVLSSIYPIQQIANAIVGEPTKLLADSYLSPHQYTIKPRDVQTILNTDLLIWVNEAMIPQLSPFVKRREENKKKKTIKIGELKKLNRLTVKDKNKKNNYLTYDPHVWLSTQNAKIIAEAIAESLIVLDLDKANEKVYRENLSQFLKQVDTSKAKITKQLTKNPPRPYFIFHDAYHYFEDEFGIKHEGIIRAHAGQAPLTQHLLTLKKKMGKTVDACIFREPQFKSPIMNQLAENTTIKQSILDPLGYQKEVPYSRRGYTQILENIATQLSTCAPIKNQ